jgi:pimeloyl-ACP methyl ester carboxylesterase
MLLLVQEVCTLLLGAGCSLQRVVASLSFAPPTPPSYRLEVRRRTDLLDYLRSSSAAGRRERGGQGGYDLRIDPRVPTRAWPPGLTLYTEVTTARGKRIPVGVWMYPGSDVTLLFSHGNSSDLGLQQSMLVDLAVNLRANVVAYDYTGFGHAQGPPREDGSVRVRPCEADLYADSAAVVDFCVREGAALWGCAGLDSIVLYGQSIGTAPSIYGAARTGVRGLVLHSPLASGLTLVLGHPPPCGPLSFLLDPFDSIHRLGRLKAHAVLVLHGEEDDVIPVEHGRALLEALPPRYERGEGAGASGSPFVQAWFPPAAGHHDVEVVYRTAYFTRLRTFLVDAAPARADAGSQEGYIRAPVLSERAVADRLQAGLYNSPESAPRGPAGWSTGRQPGLAGGASSERARAHVAESTGAAKEPHLQLHRSELGGHPITSAKPPPLPRAGDSGGQSRSRSLDAVHLREELASVGGRPVRAVTEGGPRVRDDSEEEVEVEEDTDSEDDRFPGEEVQGRLKVPVWTSRAIPGAATATG